MTSEVSVANRALQILGDEPIISLDEANKRARAMRVAFEPVRDAELRRRRWRFAMSRASLPADATAPTHGYGYRYLVPNDFLRLVPGGDLISVADTSDYRSTEAALYSLEGRYILTDLGAPLNIRYVARIEDPSVFDAAFSEALAARLAYECCDAITQSDSKQQLCQARYREAIREAKRANALEVAPESVADDTWVIGRTQ